MADAAAIWGWEYGSETESAGSMGADSKDGAATAAVCTPTSTEGRMARTLSLVQADTKTPSRLALMAVAASARHLNARIAGGMDRLPVCRATDAL